MNTIPFPSLTAPLKLPIRVVHVDDEPKLMAGGVAITPVNQFLFRRRHDQRTTKDSLDTYLRAARLYTEFCAHRGRSLLGLTNDEFIIFKGALKGMTFPDSGGGVVCLSGIGDRGPRTVDHQIELLYTIAGEIENHYQVRFDWRRYQGLPNELVVALRLGGIKRPRQLTREHSVKWTQPKILGLPDDQFVILLKTAYERWGNYLAEGDVVNADDPEAQRGALFYRNVAILFVVRFAGSRRSEVVHLTFEDIDRERGLLYLVTKGYGGAEGKRLPVIMFPQVFSVIWAYVTRYQPATESVLSGSETHVFLSHSPQNYGQPISPLSVHAIIKELRPSLDPPWDKLCTLHTLRHSFGYDLQRLGRPGAMTINMRHASMASSRSYLAGPEILAEEVLAGMGRKLNEIFERAGLMGMIESA